MAWPMDNNLFERDGINKVFGKENEGERTIFLALVTIYVTPLALAMHIHLGGLDSTKYFGSKVI